MHIIQFEHDVPNDIESGNFESRMFHVYTLSKDKDQLLRDFLSVFQKKARSRSSEGKREARQDENCI